MIVQNVKVAFQTNHPFRSTRRQGTREKQFPWQFKAIIRYPESQDSLIIYHVVSIFVFNNLQGTR